jgi:hypothetical protein
MFLAAALISAIASTPAHIVAVDGAATISRDGRMTPATLNATFIPGDRLQTTAGRIEVIFPDATTLDVDEQSVVVLESPTVLRLIMGRLRLAVSPGADPRVAGRYRIDTERGNLTLEAGEEAFAREGETPLIAAEEPPPTVEDQPSVVQVYGGAQVITERCSLTVAPSLAEIARRQPHHGPTTRTIRMVGLENPPAVPNGPPAPPPAPVVVPHSTGAIVSAAHEPTVALARQVRPEPVPTPAYAVALPRVQTTPAQGAPSHVAPSHVAPSHVAPSSQSHPAPSQAAGAGKVK